MYIIPKKYDIVLTFSPIEEITGHWFEVFEYYAYLKNNGFSACMLYNTPNIEREEIISSLSEKYNIDIPEDDIFVINYKELLIACNNSIVILCDGNFKSLINNGIKILSKKILGFGCGNIEYPYGDYKNAEYLLDKRVYNVSYGTHYTKKIYSSIMKYPICKKTNCAMLYLTKNCRKFSKNRLLDMLDDINYFEKYYIITPEPDYYNNISDKIITITPPVKNVFNLFDTYIYTPVPRKFDCSPRFIAECSLFKKEIIYYDIDYFDCGLETRKYDIVHNKCWLEDNDDIIDILRKFM